MTLAYLGQIDPHSKLARPLFLEAVSAGFPSPAEDYIARKLDLNEYLIANPDATFYWRVAGESMRDAGIFDGDILIVDRAREARSGSIVVAYVDGEYTCKRFKERNKRAYLVPANPAFSEVEITSDRDIEIWGVVVHAVRSFQP